MIFAYRNLFAILNMYFTETLQQERENLVILFAAFFVSFSI